VTSFNNSKKPTFVKRGSGKIKFLKRFQMILFEIKKFLAHVFKSLHGLTIDKIYPDYVTLAVNIRNHLRSLQNQNQKIKQPPLKSTKREQQQGEGC
jgi:hypothetical protein